MAMDSIPIEEIWESSERMLEWFEAQCADKEPRDRIELVYNNAIRDCAQMMRDVAKENRSKNPAGAHALETFADWLVLYGRIVQRDEEKVRQAKERAARLAKLPPPTLSGPIDLKTRERGSEPNV